MENAKEVLNAFDRAIQKHKNRPKIEVPKRKFFPCFSIPVVSSLYVFLQKTWESRRAHNRNLSFCSHSRGEGFDGADPGEQRVEGGDRVSRGGALGRQ